MPKSLMCNPDTPKEQNQEGKRKGGEKKERGIKQEKTNKHHHTNVASKIAFGASSSFLPTPGGCMHAHPHAKAMHATAKSRRHLCFGRNKAGMQQAPAGRARWLPLPAATTSLLLCLCTVSVSQFTTEI